MRAYERFLNYVKVWTTSDENSQTVPSAKREFDLAYLLVDELKELGVVDLWLIWHLEKHLTGFRRNIVSSRIRK